MSLSSCSTCNERGRVEKWKSFGSGHTINTTPNRLQVNSNDCLLCACIWHSIQQFPIGRDLLQRYSTLFLDLGYWSDETFRVRFDHSPPRGKAIEHGFDLVVSSGSGSFAHGVAELSAVPNRSPIPASPISDATLSNLQKWISDCSKHHTHSRGSKQKIVPDRLIDLGPPFSQADPVLLDNTTQVNEPYVALSHCWGGLIPYRTLKANKDKLCERMEFSRLSENFQDAVKVVRCLKIRFIWIDSFCIIQDDSQDWLEQAAKMASIYSSAFLTICATRSASYDEGILSHRGSDIPLWLANRLPPGVTVYVRDADKLELGHDSINSAPHTSKDNAPLFQRAWCFQERILSPRVVHFMETELVFECEEELLCECGEQESYERPPEKQLHRTDPNGPPSATWEELVEKYTDRQLTYAQDILPAISAIARDYPIKKYIAGLSGDNFMSNLLWSAKARKNDNGAVLALPTRPSVYTAPTFSWASVIAPVQWHHVESASWRFIASLYGEDIWLENESDPFGRVKPSYVVISAPAIEASMRAAPKVSDGFLKGTLYHYDTQDPLVVNFDTMGDPKPFVILTCVTICVQTSWYNRRFGIVLNRSERNVGMYERVGCFWDAKEQLFADASEQEFSIM